MLKKCTKCGKLKSISDFYTNWINKHKKRIFRSACKECTRRECLARMYEYVRRPETKERRKIYLKKYNQRKYVKKKLQQYYKEYYKREEVQKRIKNYRKLSRVIECHKKSNEKYMMKPGIKTKYKEWRKVYSKKPEIIKRRRQYERERITNNPIHKLNIRFATAICKALRGDKGGRHWESLVGYTVQDLKKHLESKFKKDMSWDNYGSHWHIDHIKPRNMFNYNSPNDSKFQECWSLKNLQPLEVYLNCSKQDRYVG